MIDLGENTDDHWHDLCHGVGGCPMSLLTIFLVGVVVTATIGFCVVAVLSVQRASERLDRILSEESDGDRRAETWELRDSGCPAVPTGGYFVAGILDDQPSSDDCRERPRGAGGRVPGRGENCRRLWRE